MISEAARGVAHIRRIRIGKTTLSKRVSRLIVALGDASLAKALQKKGISREENLFSDAQSPNDIVLVTH